MKNNTDISEKINLLIDFLGVSKNEFANKLGYGRSQAIYDICSGKSKPSFDFFQKLLYSEYSETVDIRKLILCDEDFIKTNQNEFSSLKKVPQDFKDNFLTLISEDQHIKEGLQLIAKTQISKEISRILAETINSKETLSVIQGLIQKKLIEQ